MKIISLDGPHGVYDGFSPPIKKKVTLDVRKVGLLKPRSD